VILAALQRGSAHGYDLRTAITEMTRGEISADAGGLYRTLRRLEEDGFVTSRWVEGEAGPQRRDYSITPEGHELAADWALHLKERARLLTIVSGLIDSADEVMDR
jgi:DNA-binding PadR family transcriptional regulator